MIYVSKTIEHRLIERISVTLFRNLVFEETVSQYFKTQRNAFDQILFKRHFTNNYSLISVSEAMFQIL